MLGKQLKALGSAIRSNVWFLEGGEPNTGKVLRVIFIGGDQQKEYIARLIYNSDCLSTWAGKLYLPQIQYLLLRILVIPITCSGFIRSPIFLTRWVR